MTTETKLQQQRKGNLADLPILLAGELGYALDAKRLFIGNTVSAINGDGISVDLNFGVDLDTATGSAYKVYVDGVLQIETTDYTKNNFVFTFTVAPPVGTGNVQLYHNSEIFLFEPDVGLDIPGLVGLTGPAALSSIASISFDGTRYDNVDIRYSLRNAIGHIRKGVLSIAVDAVTNTDTISDNYTTNATTVGSLLDHAFTGSMVGGIYTLQYITTDTTTANLSWLTDNFKATV
jgi:hypothetical protein